MIYLFIGVRGYLARKHFKQMKLISQTYRNEIQQFCTSIEDISNQLLQKLTQLNDKLPGLILVFSFVFEFCFF